jgi:D-alanine-D-alanine ligase
LECEGAARVDFRITPKGRPYVLEINTVPGMTETSLLPMAAAQAGIDYDQLVEWILQSALDRAGRSAQAAERESV